MRLKKSHTQPAQFGFDESYSEVWDLGGGYEINIKDLNHDICGITVIAPDEAIHDPGLTYEIAPYLGVSRKEEDMTLESNGRDLWLVPSIDCCVLYYKKPKEYKVLLEKIEKIVNKYFKKNDMTS